MSTKNISLYHNFSTGEFKWNTTESATFSFESFMSLPGIKVSFITLYITVLIVSLIGNGMVIVTVVRVKTLQTVRNLFILNLAVTDILMGTLAAPITPLSYYLQSWILGEFLCSLFPVGYIAFSHVSTFTCAAIAVHRYSQIVMPAQRQLSKRACLKSSFVIWALAVSIGIPPGVYAEVWTYKEYSYCVQSWPSFNDQKAYLTIIFFSQFVIPCAVITFCYLKVWRSVGLYDWMMAPYFQLEEGDFIAVRQTNRMLIVMVVVFVVCWLPLNILYMVLLYNPYSYDFTIVEIVFFITDVMAMSSTAWNPIIYAGMDRCFQKEFKKIYLRLLMLTGIGSQTNSNVSAEPEITASDMVEYASNKDSVNIVHNELS